MILIIGEIYLITTEISWLTMGILGITGSKRLEREGYQFVKDVKERKSFLEKLKTNLPIVIEMSFPAYNIISAIAILCTWNKSYNNAKQNLLKKGTIYRIIENKYEEDSLSSDINETNFENIQKTSAKDNEMSIGTKISYLREERDRLMRDDNDVIIGQTNEEGLDNKHQKHPFTKTSFSCKK